ncbi:hypothetical protein [Variovorax paradoxus]|uniref:hypothetical protein n=1 Tax=Variovorax paradoxus TaxID=34073 RepID=UPI0005ACA8C5|nr:hypothetical protein [Variovorax paradoxus]
MTKKQDTEERPRRGRPTLPDDVRAVHGSVRLTRDRWAKLRRLGTAWLSGAIDRAKEQAPRK